jgi:outer membrane protein
MTTAADPARARAALAEVQAEAAGHRAAFEEARAALAALIGAEAARRPLAALPGPGAVPESVAAERDDVAASELSAKAAHDQEKAASRSRLPALLIQGRYELHAPKPADRWGDSASIFGGFRIPLFASGAIDSRVAESRAAALSAEASASSSRRAAQKEIASARAELSASEARVAAFSEAEAAARQAREIQQARYDEGAARLADLLEARAAELRARLGVSGAKAERVAAEAKLRLALGLPPEGEEP